jgi:hypothetical protein
MSDPKNENNQNPHHEKVRYYIADLSEERFPQRKRSLSEWKDLSNDELLRAREEILKEIFKRFGS